MTSLPHLAKSLVKRGLEHGAARFGAHTRSGTPRLWVLMYHRILPREDARSAHEEPGMIVTPETFRQHLHQLKQLFEVLPLSAWIERRNANKPLPDRACAITFDDGWLDNFEFALPILEQEQVPATLFAVSHMIGTQREFWPNRLARALIAAHDANAALNWLQGAPGYAPSRTPDREYTAALIDYCKRFPDSDLHAWLDDTEQRLNIAPAATPSLMSWDQLRQMQASGLVEVGSHTCNHFRLLDSLPRDTLAAEIAESRHRLEHELERPVQLFCYPNGDACVAAVEQVRRHYTAAVTTRRGINSSGTDAHELLRIGVHEDISRTPGQFKARLSGWL